MDAKIALGKLIVTDFHSAAEAEHAAEVFQRVVREKEIPADIESAAMPDGVVKDGMVRVDKLIAKLALVPSVTEAVRKIKAGAVHINGEKVGDLAVQAQPGELLIQVGKNWKRVAG